MTTVTPWTVESPWLQGYYAPVFDELDVVDLPVSGELPASLQGALLRNGANPAFPPLGRYHLFDGDGMVHGLYLADGRAGYRNRWVRSAGFEAEQRAGRALFGGLAEFTPPDPEVAAEVGFMKNTANTHVVSHAGRILALMEAAKPIELTSHLDTVGEHDFGGALAGSMTAHPRLDPVTGEMVFFGYAPFPPYLRVHAADARGDLVWSTEVELPGPVMMHDFVITESSVVIFDLPAVFDLQAMLGGGEGIRWDPDHGARIGVLRRGAAGDTVRWTEVEPFWAFHLLNAHDSPAGAIVVEGCRADRLNTSFGPAELTEPVHPRLHRWTIAADGSVTDEALDDRPADFPRVDDRRVGLAARYGYVGHTRHWDDDAEFDGVTKHDLEAGTSITHRFGDGAVTGEPVFAPDPERDGEDAGWILSWVHDRATERSSVVVLDAAGLDEVARVHLPRRVPFGFHGSWVPAS